MISGLSEPFPGDHVSRVGELEVTDRLMKKSKIYRGWVVLIIIYQEVLPCGVLLTFYDHAKSFSFVSQAEPPPT